MTDIAPKSIPKSARLLGQPYGLTAVEMNVLLKQEGYLGGDPGAYRVTPKGEPFAHEKDEHRGTGGYSWYNPQWETRSWDPRILDEINITPERRREVQESASEQRRQRAEARAAEEAALDAPADKAAVGRSMVDGRALLMLAGVVAIGVGLYKFAVPRLKARRAARAERLRRQSKPGLTDGTGTDGDLPGGGGPA